MPAPSVTARSSMCRGPKRKSSRANGQSSVRPNIVNDGNEHQHEHPIWPAESGEQRRAEGAVDKYQADDRHHQRKEGQRPHFSLRHATSECHDEDDGNEQQTQRHPAKDSNRSSRPRTAVHRELAAVDASHRPPPSRPRRRANTPDRSPSPRTRCARVQSGSATQTAAAAATSPAIGTCTAKMKPIALRRLS